MCYNKELCVLGKIVSKTHGYNPVNVYKCNALQRRTILFSKNGIIFSLALIININLDPFAKIHNVMLIINVTEWSQVV